MSNILFRNYIGLEDNQVLRIKLQRQQDALFGLIGMIGGLQPYQDAWTPNNTADMHVIKDLQVYRDHKRITKNNSYDVYLNAGDVESIEVVDIFSFDKKSKQVI